MLQLKSQQKWIRKGFYKKKAIIVGDEKEDKKDKKIEDPLWKICKVEHPLDVENDQYNMRRIKLTRFCIVKSWGDEFKA